MTTLPEPGDLPMPLGEALLTRRSRYRYGPLEPRALSALLRYAVGVKRDGLGTAPAAGGLPSIRVHVVGEAVHEYRPADHTLHRVGERPDLHGVFVQEEFARRAHTVLVLSARMAPGLAKYGPVHRRTVHLDAGIALQNLYLVGTALGLSCCAVVGYDEAAVTRLVGLVEPDFPLALFVVG